MGERSASGSSTIAVWAASCAVEFSAWANPQKCTVSEPAASARRSAIIVVSIESIVVLGGYRMVEFVGLRVAGRGRFRRLDIRLSVTCAK